MSNLHCWKHFFAAVLLVFIPLSSASAQDPGPQELDGSIHQFESNIQKLKSGIEIHLGQLQIAGQKEFNLLAEIERMDNKLALQRVRLDVMEERLTSQKEIFTVKLQELKQAEAKRDEIRKHLQVRLRSYYIMGKTGILNVTFSTRPLPELMLFNDSFKMLLDYDQNLLMHFRQAIDQLLEATSEYHTESNLLNTYIADTHEQQKELDLTRGKKKELLQKVKTQKVLHEQALREMQKAEKELKKSLAKLQQKRAYNLKGFLLNKGTMPPPVSGVIVRQFGNEQDKNVSSGITIEAENDAPIKAIFPGRVVFAGYRRGYGNTVIIDHGLKYYSVTARMEKIFVKEDDRVDKGTVIGSAGDIATLFDKGLYFEIRRDTEPVDPLEWITREGLSSKPAVSEEETSGAG